ncbi:hypothetical protein [Endozoicomonas sp. ALC066]|uniref:hypothetical protein n=1 Tax=Endozoicomonas sp. ALC066 TaxID=3403078 RepID=UPI003BB54219
MIKMGEITVEMFLRLEPCRAVDSIGTLQVGDIGKLYRLDYPFQAESAEQYQARLGLSHAQIMEMNQLVIKAAAIKYGIVLEDLGEFETSGHFRWKEE